MGTRTLFAAILAVACVPATAPQRPAPGPTAYVAGWGAPHGNARSGQRQRGLPNDPLWPMSWGLRAVGAPSIWRRGSGSPGVVVAVVDTGVDPSAPDLKGALVPGWSSLGDPGDTGDRFGHGTQVANVVAGRVGNGVGGAGYCPRCSVMPVKVLDAGGHGTGRDIAAGIDWAVAHGANVVNLSLVLDQPDPTVSASIANAIAHGVLVVAAAGNDGGTSLHEPAAEPGVVSVAAFDPAQRLYSWSSGGSWTTVAAPGCNESAAGEFCGTSSATAAVSGVLALALSDGASPEAARAALAATAVHGSAVPLIDARALLAGVGARSAGS